MGRRVAAVVTTDDLKMFFKGEMGGQARGNIDDTGRSKNPHLMWSVEEGHDGSLTVNNSYFRLNFVPESAMYHVEIRANDDPSDTDSDVTDNPVAFLVSFMGTGTEGDEFFQRMSSSPNAIAWYLKKLAVRVASGKMGKRDLKKGLLLAGMAIDPPWLNKIRQFIRFALEQKSFAPEDSLLDMKKLQAEMKEKGWKSDVDIHEDRPILTVDVGGIYTAKITVDSVMWDCTFDREGDESKHTEENAADPISSAQTFFHEATKPGSEPAETDSEQGQYPDQGQEGNTIPAKSQKNYD